jgi:hypothetical protein
MDECSRASALCRIENGYGDLPSRYIAVQGLRRDDRLISNATIVNHPLLLDVRSTIA